MSATIINLFIQLIAGAIGGNAAGAISKPRKSRRSMLLNQASPLPGRSPLRSWRRPRRPPDQARGALAEARASKDAPVLPSGPVASLSAQEWDRGATSIASFALATVMRL